jgi:hypothetical protein
MSNSFGVNLSTIYTVNQSSDWWHIAVIGLLLIIVAWGIWQIIKNR